MQITFNVTVDGKTTEITTSYTDIIALEEKFDIDASELKQRQRASWLAYLAWHALKRKNETTKTYEDFANGLEVLEAKNKSQQGNA